MTTARRTWQLFESRVAAFFGCRRAVLSGSSGRDDATCSDSTHPTLFVECKLREKHAARTLHDATRALARKEGKTPVLALADKGRPGFLICVHSDDWRAVVAEWAASLPESERDELEGEIRRATRRRQGIDAADSA
jgi:hypothetical protein